MSGSGARDRSGSPPWGPADPVPDLEDTQAIPGLGSVPEPAVSGSGGAQSPGDTADAGGTGDPGGGTGDLGPKPRPPGRKRPRTFWGFWRELLILVVIALALALVIKSFAVQAFFIPSASMENTLDVNDRVLINKIVYHLRPIHRGDIVVFDGTGSWDPDTQAASPNIFAKAVDELEGIVGISHDSSIYIKRVIGLPGDRVACCNTRGQVTVNGVPLSESSYLYPGNAPSSQRFAVTVPAGELWVMGDHRQISYDSRGHMGDPGGGAIPQSAVLGRAFVIIWPPSRWGILNIPATFEQPALGTPVQAAGSAVPLALGFAGAVPLTWLQRRVRRRGKRGRTAGTTSRSG